KDVAEALKALVDRAEQLGIDRCRIVLMGHSAGGNLVALLGTDESYLLAAGLSYKNLAGVVTIDGAGFEVATEMERAGKNMYKTYQQAFGSKLARQRKLSPLEQASEPNAPSFLILHIDRPPSTRRSKMF